MAVLAVATVGGIWVTGRVIGADFDAWRFALAGVLAWAFGCAVAGVTTLLAVLTLSRGRAAGIVGGVLVVMYLVFVVVQVNADLQWLAPVSAWDHMRTTELIDKGSLPVGDLALFAGVAVAGWAGAIAAFRRRDLAG
jgi:hypothetical protein